MSRKKKWTLARACVDSQVVGEFNSSIKKQNKTKFKQIITIRTQGATEINFSQKQRQHYYFFLSMGKTSLVALSRLRVNLNPNLTFSQVGECSTHCSRVSSLSLAVISFNYQKLLELYEHTMIINNSSVVN